LPGRRKTIKEKPLDFLVRIKTFQGVAPTPGPERSLAPLSSFGALS
jgi:hypothetical protein